MVSLNKEKINKKAQKGEKCMLEDKIKRKREELNESIEKHQKYEDVYKLSVELDDLITEFYKESEEKRRQKCLFRKRKQFRKILYLV